MKNIKKLVSVLVAVIMVLGLNSYAFAGSTETPTSVSLDLSNYDLTTSFSETKTITDSEGNQVEVTNTFVPKPQTRGTSTETAVEGTWNAYCNYGLYSLEFTFDLAKTSNGGWEITSAGDIEVFALFADITSSSVTIINATTSPTSLARVSAQALGTIYGPNSIPIVSGSFGAITVTISHSGVVTTTW